jgi:hypothetical protein
MDRKAVIKKHLITAIKEKGFPNGYVEDEADFYAGIFIDENEKIHAVGYAKDFISDKGVDLDNIKLEDLTIVELAKLLENGCVVEDKDYKHMKATVDEDLKAEPVEA